MSAGKKEKLNRQMRAIVAPFMLLAAYPQVKALFGNPFTPERRLQAMPQILSVNIALGAFYAAAVLAASQVALVL